MNKKLLLLIVLAVIGGAIIYFFSGKNQMPFTASIWAPVDVFGDVVPIRGKSFVSTSTGVTVSFGKKINFDDGTANGYVDVMVNNKVIGTTHAIIQSLLGFSPDNKYFGFRMYTPAGSTFHSSLLIVDMASSMLINVPAPYAEARDYPRSKINTRVGDVSNLSDTIESYTWDRDAIDVVFYFVAGEFDENADKVTYYRATPKELWRYDLNKKSYALIKTLSE